MSEAQVVALSVVSWVAAMMAVPCPWWVLAPLGAVALAVRRPRVVALAVIVAVGSLAASAERGLLTSPRAVRGETATVLRDPEKSWSRVRTVLEVGGRHWDATADGEAAETIEGLAVGSTVQVSGWAGRSDVAWPVRASRHLAGELVVRVARSPGRPAPWWGGAQWVRGRIQKGASSIPHAQRALFDGVVLGDDRLQDAAARARFRASGLAHLLVVSGQNLGFVLLLLSPLTSRSPLAVRAALTAAMVCGFVFVVRFEPSVLRAAAMVGVQVVATWSGRFVGRHRLFGVALVVLLMLDPLLVWSTGFRLSVAATAGLLWWYEPLMAIVASGRAGDVRRVFADADPHAGWRGWALRGICGSISAEAAVGPLVVGFAGSVPLLGPLTNLLAAGAAAGVMMWGVTAGLLAGVLGGRPAAVLHIPTRAFLWWLDLMARFGAAPGLPRIGPVGTAVVASAVAGVALRHGSRSGSAGVIDRRPLGVGRRPCSAGKGPRREWAGGLRRVVVVVAVAAVLADVGGRFDRPVGVEHRSVGGATLWRDTSSSVLWWPGGARVDAVITGLARARVDTVGLVLVTARGSPATEGIATLREVVSLGAVVAREPDDVLGAHPLVPGVVGVGSIRLRVADDLRSVHRR
ncbi:MAG: ComEC/Rec2 family competence protein [Microthrixaceae bacterium]